jgi:site-specific DNA-methyltransferase (adenine-specific)
LPINDIIQGDCIELMSAWPAESVDLIFADPPYNIGFEYDGHYHDAKPDREYLDWTYRWIDGCSRLLKPSGSFYVLIGDEYAAEVRLHLKKLQADGQLLFRNWIVWHYTFGQRCKIKFNRSHAHLFYCVGSAAVNPKTGKARSNLTKNPPFTFNYDAVAVASARQTIYNDKRANAKGKLPDDTWYLRPQEAMADPLNQAADIPLFDPESDTWNQSRLCGTFREREQWHPCQLPEALLERIIRCSSNEGDPPDLVFDPFAGSGTTLAVAHQLGRSWLGCELSPDYRNKALERIHADPEKRASRQVVTNNGKRAGASASQ